LFELNKVLRILRNRRWGIALLAIWLLYVAIVGGLGAWHYAGVPRMSRIFSDWHAVFSAVDCHKLGLDVFAENPCDQWFRKHAYGGLWLQLGNLGLGLRDVFWSGVIINAVFMVTAVVLVRPSSASELIIGAAILLSPTIMLAIERVNNDLIIFELVALTAWLVASRRRHGQIGGLLVTTLAAFLKFYPAALFGGIALVARTRKDFLIAVVGGACLLGVWIYLSVHELVRVLPNVPRPDGLFATGSTLLFELICPTCPIFAISLVAATIAASVAILLSRNVSITPFSTGMSRQCFVQFCLGLTVLLSTFLINSNFDYRWVLFILLVPMLFELRRQPLVDRLTKRLVVLILGFTLIVMWCGALMFYTPAVWKIVFEAPWSQAHMTAMHTYLGAVKQAAAWLSLTFATAIAIRALVENYKNCRWEPGKMTLHGSNANAVPRGDERGHSVIECR
jgi:hypothetical protein